MVEVEDGWLRITGKIDEIGVLASYHPVICSKNNPYVLPMEKRLQALIPNSQHSQLRIAGLKGIRDRAAAEPGEAVVGEGLPFNGVPNNVTL
jgi:ribosomal 30S subunit maturation factor RimM